MVTIRSFKVYDVTSDYYYCSSTTECFDDEKEYDAVTPATVGYTEFEFSKIKQKFDLDINIKTPIFISRPINQNKRLSQLRQIHER